MYAIYVFVKETKKTSLMKCYFVSKTETLSLSLHWCFVMLPMRGRAFRDGLDKDPGELLPLTGVPSYGDTQS